MTTMWEHFFFWNIFYRNFFLKYFLSQFFLQKTNLFLPGESNPRGRCAEAFRGWRLAHCLPPNLWTKVACLGCCIWYMGWNISNLRWCIWYLSWFVWYLGWRIWYFGRWLAHCLPPHWSGLSLKKFGAKSHDCCKTIVIICMMAALLSESFPSREAKRPRQTQLQQLQERRRWRVRKVKVKKMES